MGRGRDQVSRKRHTSRREFPNHPQGVSGESSAEKRGTKAVCTIHGEQWGSAGAAQEAGRRRSCRRMGTGCGQEAGVCIWKRLVLQGVWAATGRGEYVHGEHFLHVED